MAGKTALVVDDSKSARFALRRFLENKGYAVDTAENANEAYAYLKQRRPDVVFLDQMMPGVSGFDALRTIRMEMELISLPIIICSSNEGDTFVRQARAQGADDVLPKPPNELHINAVLDRLINAKAAVPAAPAPETKVTPMAPPKAPEPKTPPPARESFTAKPRTVDIEPASEEELAAIDMASLDLPIEETSQPAAEIAETPPPAPAPVVAAPATPPPMPAPAPTPAPAPAMATAAAPEPVQTTTATGAPKMEQKVVSMSPDSAAKGGSEIERKLKELADRIEALNKTVGSLGNRLEPILRSSPAAPAKSAAPLDPSLSRVSKSVVEATNKLGDIESIVQSLIERSDV